MMKITNLDSDKLLALLKIAYGLKHIFGVCYLLTDNFWWTLNILNPLYTAMSTSYTRQKSCDVDFSMWITKSMNQVLNQLM